MTFVGGLLADKFDLKTIYVIGIVCTSAMLFFAFLIIQAYH